MNVLIVDDEVNNRTLVKDLLENYSFVDEIQAVGSSMEALISLKTFKPDIVFLDVEMPGGSGLNFLEALTERYFKVVFITAHEKYALQALKEKAYDYLLKPIDTIEFEKVLFSLKEGMLNSGKERVKTNDRIIISTQEDTFFIKPKNITRISSAGSYCIYHLANGKDIVASYVLKKANETLSSKMFVRVHNSTIVNINFIERIRKTDGNTIVMKDGTKVSISRRRKEEFMALILNRL